MSSAALLIRCDLAPAWGFIRRGSRKNQLVLNQCTSRTSKSCSYWTSFLAKSCPRHKFEWSGNKMVLKNSPGLLQICLNQSHLINHNLSPNVHKHSASAFDAASAATLDYITSGKLATIGSLQTLPCPSIYCTFCFVQTEFVTGACISAWPLVSTKMWILSKKTVAVTEDRVLKFAKAYDNRQICRFVVFVSLAGVSDPENYKSMATLYKKSNYKTLHFLCRLSNVTALVLCLENYHFRPGPLQGWRSAWHPTLRIRFETRL